MATIEDGKLITLSELATALGSTPNAVYLRLKRHGVQPAGRRRRPGRRGFPPNVYDAEVVALLARPRSLAA